MDAAAKLGGGIWLYGSMELFWHDSKLTMIYWDNEYEGIKGGTIDLDPWFLAAGLAVERVESELAAAGIQFRNGRLSKLDQVLIRADSGVQFNFGRDEEGTGPHRLDSFHTTESPHPDIVWDAAR